MSAENPKPLWLETPLVYSKHISAALDADVYLKLDVSRVVLLACSVVVESVIVRFYSHLSRSNTGASLISFRTLCAPMDQTCTL